MTRTLGPLHLLCVPLLVAGCLSHPPDQAFAQASCGGCHAVGRYGLSSNANAPPFAAIVNREGLTAETLSAWLRGAHNYPREMDFYIGEREVIALLAYMMTLKDPNYVRPPD